MGTTLYLEIVTVSYKFGELHNRDQQNSDDCLHQFIWRVAGTPQATYNERRRCVSNVGSFGETCASRESQCIGSRNGITRAIGINNFDTMIQAMYGQV